MNPSLPTRCKLLSLLKIHVVTLQHRSHCHFPSWRSWHRLEFIIHKLLKCNQHSWYFINHSSSSHCNWQIHNRHFNLKTFLEQLTATSLHAVHIDHSFTFPKSLITVRHFLLDIDYSQAFDCSRRRRTSALSTPPHIMTNRFIGIVSQH